MKSSHVVRELCGRWVLAALMALALAGCAAPAGGNEPRGDIVTQSDEPEARRRAAIRLELAVGYFQQGQTTVALDEIKQALTADPNFADAFNVRGLIYMRLGDMRLAEDSFRRALQLRPRDGDILHNYAWMLCHQERYAESNQYFAQAVAVPQYTGQPKSFMAQGLCQIKAGQKLEAERTLLHAYEMDASNPITGYNLALLLFQRGEFQRAQFYIRRINNSDQASAETLWLGMRVERRMDNRDALMQLGMQLKRRFPNSREAAAYDRGAYDE